MNHDKRKTLLQYWTTRYVLTLVTGLLVIGVFSFFWLQYQATEKRLGMMSMLAEEIADRVVDSEGNLQVDPSLQGIIDRRARFLELGGRLIFLILDQDQQLIYPKRAPLPEQYRIPLDPQEPVQKISFGEGKEAFVITRQMERQGAPVGWVILLQPHMGLMVSKEPFQFLVIMLASLGVLGWGVIYLLTRKLSQPIKEVAEAAKQIVTGNYQLELDREIKEKEIYELVESFKDMADRLEKAEVMRTELLAGVTHELKTPVTSISALVQAVRDEVVSGEEAKEFLDISLKDTVSLQKMVEDLLDFNSFAVGDVTVHKEVTDLNQLIQEITYQWTIVQGQGNLQVETILPEQSILMATDPLRVQQILTNLLNNAKQAMLDEGKLQVTLYQREQEVRVDVLDEGPGIPQEEQPLIFEKFYRGMDKKHRIRGLGLGLPYSKMMAKALGGDLLLKQSTAEGTVFSLILNRPT
ncbi:HAMP domain-containing sensor histidine kinase [Ammoniphilus sp. YIM 78166]|uniref:sensor histidine kinase n=1 Tax=Ammoniphilus sp. YIM 78166 TaxID=1644106 RepID=UPI0010702B0B|nr:HAMP domain-containing sensor histidine kinase [Ammoniphilus sp. YIM 78166]